MHSEPRFFLAGWRGGYALLMFALRIMCTNLFGSRSFFYLMGDLCYLNNANAFADRLAKSARDTGCLAYILLYAVLVSTFTIVHERFTQDHGHHLFLVCVVMAV
jgi:hypothetical protein